MEENKNMKKRERKGMDIEEFHHFSIESATLEVSFIG